MVAVMRGFAVVADPRGLHSGTSRAHDCAAGSRPMPPVASAATTIEHATACFMPLPGSSELVFHRELHDPLRAAVRCDAAELTRIEVGLRIAPVEVVQEVEGFDAQFDSLARGYRNQPRQAQVHRPECRTFDAV